MSRVKTEKTKVNRTFSIDEDVDKEIDSMAEKLGLSKSAIVNMMLRGVCFSDMELVTVMLDTVKAQSKPKKRSKATPALA